MLLKQAHITLNAKKLVSHMENGTMKFDNAIQRGLVWDLKRKSLLISSMMENYPIPPFYATKNGDEYDMLDGKQRCNTIRDFILGGKDGKGGFKLVALDEIEYEVNIKDETGTHKEIQTIDVNGMKFSDLPKELQDVIQDYTFTTYYFDEITDEIKAEMFMRINNGKALSAIELNRVKAKSIDVIQALGQHELFIKTLKKQAFVKYNNEDLVIKAWGTIFVEDISFGATYIRPLLQNTEITQEQTMILDSVFTRLLKVYNLIKNKNGDKKQKSKYKSILTVMIKPTHFNSLSYVAKKSIEENIEVEQFTNWVLFFFNSEQGTTISEEYNSMVRAGTGNSKVIKDRLALVEKNYNENIGNIKSSNSDKDECQLTL